MTSSFIDFLMQHKDQVNEYVSACFTDCTDVADISRYLYEPLERFSENAGKRHRPLICMLASRAVGGAFEAAKSPAMAIELFQSAALIHDDIADNGQLRRGKPCLHITEGEGIAINCGDLALTWVTSLILNDSSLVDGTKLRLLDELTAMTERTIEGQALDLGWVRDERFDISVEDYLRMADHKTAFYSGAVPLACGAIVGGGSEEQIEALRTFGMRTGLAFQIQDDLLNLIGKEEARDKDFRTDITEGKRTLVAVHALASPVHHDELVSILSSGTTDSAMLERAVDIFKQIGSIDFARSYAQALTEQAKAALEEIDLDAECRDLLLSMADFFVARLN